MNSSIYFSSFCTIILLLSCIKIHSHRINLDFDHQWETSYYPFPEMSRFLNSNSRIHRPSSHTSYSLLGYLCSIADDTDKIEDILETFGKNYRSLIMTIIDQDCFKFHQQSKRTTININRKKFPQIFQRHMIDHYKTY